MEGFRKTDSFLERHATAGAITIVTLLVLLAASLFAQQSEVINRANARVKRSYNVTGHIQLLFNRLKDVELSQRGYIIAGDESYLAPYRDALKNSLGEDATSDRLEQHHSIAEELAILRRLTKEDSMQQQNLDEMDSLVKELLNYWASTAQLRAGGATKPNFDFLHGNKLMDQARGLVSIMMAEENHMLSLHIKADQDSTHQNDIYIFSGIAFFYFVMVISVLLYQKSRKAKTAELALSEERYDLVVRGMSVGLWDWNLATGKFYWSEKCKDLLGIVDKTSKLSYDDFTGRLHPEDRQAAEKMLHEHLAHRGSYDAEYRLRHDNGGYIWIHACGQAQWDGVGIPIRVVGSIDDISQRKEAERLKSDFISVVSHELRTPLTSIRGSLGLMAGIMANELPEKANRLIGIAYQNSERLVLLINDMLDIDKITSGQMRFDIKEEALDGLIGQSVESNQPYADKFGVLITALPSITNVTIRVDAMRLSQVLANLLSNAAKFSNPGDHVKVDTEISAHSVRILVKDHGPGIPEEFRPHIFGKFSQADSSVTRSKGGTGLGLHISRQIVEHMGGSIGFETQTGKGSIFWVEFPFVASKPLSISPARPDDTVAKLFHYKAKKRDNPLLLHVEDDVDLSNILATALHGKVEVISAMTLKQAERLLKELRFDIIVLDIGMPDGSGLALLKKLPQFADPHTPVMILSASEISNAVSQRVACALVKSRMSEHKIVDAILQLIGRRAA